MASDKQGGRGAGQQRPVPVRPGSVNRGFASLDPERQCEAAAQAGHAAPAADAPAAGKGRERGASAARRRPGSAAPPARDTGKDDSA